MPRWLPPLLAAALERLRRRVPPENTLGHRGTHVFPEVGLPDGFVPPSAALRSGQSGIYLDPRQIPATLMKPAMDAGQPPAVVNVYINEDADPRKVAEALRRQMRCRRMPRG